VITHAHKFYILPTLGFSYQCAKFKPVDALLDKIDMPL